MDWRETVRNNINEGEFSPQNDWDSFHKKYRRFKTIKRIRYSSFVVAILVAGLIGYHFIHQPVQNKNIVKINNQTKNLVVTKKVEPNSQKNQEKEINKESPKSSVGKHDKQSVVKNNNQNNIVNTNNTVTNLKNSNDTNNSVVENTMRQPAQNLVSADFSVDKTQGCGNLTVQFTPKEVNDNIIYIWDFGDGNFSTEEMPVHHYNNTGTFSVSLTIKYFSGNKSNKKIKKNFICVDKKPKADFSYQYIQGKEVQLKNLSTSFEQCQWLLDGYVVSTDLSPQILMKEGNHKVLLLAINKGCKDTLTKQISVYPEIKIFLPTAFTPNGDKQNDEFKPVFSHLPDSYKILIFDQLGKAVYTSTNPEMGWDGRINGNDPKSGIYLWKMVYQYKNNKPVEKSGQVKLIKN